jgi:hypothetical protein
VFINPAALLVGIAAQIVFTLTLVYTPFLHRYSAPPRRQPANSCWWSLSPFIVWGRRITPAVAGDLLPRYAHLPSDRYPFG